MAVGAAPREVYRIAADMERLGEALYSSLAEGAADPSIEELYRKLAEEEREHRELMEERAAAMEDVVPGQGYRYDPERAMALLRGYRSIFDEDRLQFELERNSSPPAVLDFAIRREMDSIMFYHEAMDMVPQMSRKALRRIIEQEREHFGSLSKLRESLED